MKTITIKPVIWERLTSLKLELRRDSLNDVIEYLLYELDREDIPL